MKRLILVVPGFYPDSRGGAARQARILAEALGRHGVDVTVVAPTTSLDAPAREAASFGQIERLRVRAYPSDGGKRIGSFIAWTRWFRGRFGGAEWRGVPVYVFHARLHALGPALAAIASGSPLMIKLGGGGEASDFAALRAKKFFYGRWVQNLLLRRVDRFVANGAEIVSDLKALGVPDGRIAAFNNGVALPPQGAVDEALAVRQGDRFVFSGRMVADKNIHVLYEAAKALGNEARPPKLTFLGEGPEEKRLAALPGRPGNIDFAGYVADIYPPLMAADFFVSASMREGQSNALLEAMSAGVIPIVYNCSGVADVVRHGVTGFVVEASTPGAFAQAMRTALALEPANRKAMSLAARKFAEDSIGIDAIAARTIAVIDGIAEREA